MYYCMMQGYITCPLDLRNFLYPTHDISAMSQEYIYIYTVGLEIYALKKFGKFCKIT